MCTTYSRQLGCRAYVETSAKQRLNIEELFSEVIREIRRNNPSYQRKLDLVQKLRKTTGVTAYLPWKALYRSRCACASCALHMCARVLITYSRWNSELKKLQAPVVESTVPKFELGPVKPEERKLYAPKPPSLHKASAAGTLSYESPPLKLGSKIEFATHG